MAYDLIIVESPAKAKTIGNFLGKDYIVIASKGHIRDLPGFYLGVKITDNAVEPKYEIKDDHKHLAKEITSLAKKAKQIYIATDEDREGEAIGWHLTHILGGNYDQYPRIVFHEITKSAITHALETARKIDIDKVNAQQARRILDRVVGFTLSQLLQNKIQKGLSAGRVQSATLKIIVDREKEIKSFVPVTYYTINGIFNNSIEGTIIDYKGEAISKMSITDKAKADEIVSVTSGETFKIKSIENKKRKSSTPPPFMTSTLQQATSSKFGYNPTKTMQIAQKLYEGVETHLGMMGAITYMRTDSLNIAQEAQDAARTHILNVYGKEYVPDKPKVYTSKAKGAQEAHEAIRPTNLSFTPEIAKKYLEPDQLKVYTLIYNRFLASQSVDAEYDQQVMVLESNSSLFRANGSKLSFDGFIKIMGDDKKDKLLPPLSIGDVVKTNSITATEKQTEPPSRYSEASIVKTMEDLGIGRPSTYAATIGLLTKREYVKVENKQLVPTENAYKVISGLEEFFPNIVNSKYTAKLEEELDEVSERKKNWERLLIDFNRSFMNTLSNAKQNMKSQKIAKETGEACPKCGQPMVERKGRFGMFECCSGFPKCKYIKPQEKKPITSEPSDVPCPKCDRNLVIRVGKFGNYFACENDACKIISKFPPVKEICEKCKSHKVKKTIKGVENIVCPKCDVKPFKFKKKGKQK